MSVVRRVLLVLVGIALVANVTALALVKSSAGPAPSDEKSKVVFWIDDKGQAELAETTLKEEGYEPLLKPSERDHFIEANYRLVYKDSSVKLVKPIANVLAKSGHKNLVIKEEDGMAKLYYGGVYKQKADAKKVAKSLETKELIKFDVEPGRKKTKKPSNRVILMAVPDNFVSGLEDKLEQAGIVIALTEQDSLEPKSDSAEEPTEE